MKYIGLSLFLVSSIIFHSCNPDTKVLKPKITGKAGEVLLILDKNKWESEVGEAFKDILLKEQAGLPQPEPVFDLQQIPPAAFSDFFKTFRNIIITKIDSRIKEPKITIQRDMWAYPQFVLNVEAPGNNEAVRVLEEKQDMIIDHFLDIERNRIIENYKKHRDHKIYTKLKKDHRLAITLPVGYNLDVEKDSFIWISFETPEISQGILIYYYDYNDANAFMLDKLIAKRNDICKKYVPGPVDKSYMATETAFKPMMKEFLKDGKYYAEIRGLWHTENAFMGGPFISLSTVDEKNNRIITVDGYVYAPGKNKRNYLRQVDAILYTLEIFE